MTVPFDPTPYVRAPILTVSSGVTLALAVADACPAGAPANVKKAQRRLRTTAEKARDDSAARNCALVVYN
jgi:predicted polyphosphate/ATP-dependent NAD kinase